MSRLILSVFIMLFLGSASFSSNTVATIDNVAISKETFSSLFDQFMNNYKSYLSFKDDAILNEHEISEIKRAVLDEILEDHITNAYAKEQNISITDQEVQARVEIIKQGFPDKKSFWKALQDENSSFEKMIASMRKELLKDRIISNISTADIHVVTTDVIQYIDKNNLSLSAVKYDIIMVVTNNEEYLLSLIEQPNINWSTAKINKLISLQNIVLEKKELPQVVQDKLVTIAPETFSKIETLDKENFFSVMVNSIIYDELNLEEIPENIYTSLLEEKRNNIYTEWLNSQLMQKSITLNKEIFPSLDISSSSLIIKNSNKEIS